MNIKVPAEVRDSTSQPWIRAEDAAVLAVWLSVALALVAFYVSSTALRIASVALQVLVFAYMFVVSSNKPLRNMSALIFALSMPFALYNSSTSEFKSIIVPICFLGGIGCAWFSIERKKTRYTLEVPFYCYLALTVYLIVVKGYGPREFNEFFSGISRNGYSAILFSTACGYVVSRSVRHKNPSVLLMAVAFACSIPLYGRSSIVAIGILFTASVMTRWPRIAFIVGIFSALILGFGYLELGFLMDLTNFRGGIESDRWQILNEYLSLINPRTLVLGVPFGEVQAIQWNAGSPDLAFVRLHSYLGIATVFLIFLFAESAWSLVRKHYWLLGAVLLAALFRAFTDVILLFGNIDLFFIPVLFFPYFDRYWKDRPMSPVVKNTLSQRAAVARGIG